MPPIIRDRVPTHFAAGTTVRFTRSLDNFLPSDGWSYKLYLNGLTQKFNKAAAVQTPDSFLIELLASDTEALAPGPYRYCERLTNPGTLFTLTRVDAVGSDGIYSFSGYTGPVPYVGMSVAITGFAGGGNNVPGIIDGLTLEGTAGSFSIPNATAVTEIHAGSAQAVPEVHDISGDELVINIEPDAASSAAGTFQTFEEKTLAILELAIAGNLSGGVQSYQIAGRAVSKYSLPELMSLRGTFRSAVWRQHYPGKLGIPYLVEFSPGQESKYPPTWVDVTGLER
jgi:hypothetical protein